MLHLNTNDVTAHQNLGTGRLSQALTGQSLRASAAVLSARADGGDFRPLRTTFAMRREGWFAFHLEPARDLPDYSAATQVTLRGEFTLPGQTTAVIGEWSFPASALALVDQDCSVGGQTVTLHVIAGAPLNLSLQLDPAPVALHGLVLIDGDPAQPAANIPLQIDSLTTATDDTGRFRFASLPLQQSLTLRIRPGSADERTQDFRPDYSQPVNQITFPLYD